MGTQLGDGPAVPDISEEDVPSRIFTFEPWLGCLWGGSCTFCYVPNLSVGLYPGARNGYLYNNWGRWIVPKPNIASRLHDQLSDTAGATSSAYRGACIFMSAKTDPFLPIPELLQITRSNLQTFLKADVFLMCQTRSPKVVEDPEIFRLVLEMAKLKKVGISFSIPSDVLEEQRRIERGGLAPNRRLDIMRQLKDSGVFVSAAVSPLMPHSVDFPRRLKSYAHHASIQILRPKGIGSSTSSGLLQEIHQSVPGYNQLEVGLSRGLQSISETSEFSWGIGNKGFIGAFLAAKRFYGPDTYQDRSSQLELSLR